MTPAEVLTWAALVSACAAGPVILVLLGRWIERRTHASEVAVATFLSALDVAATDAGLPQMGDVVAEAERTVYEAEICDLLTDAIEYVEAVRG